MKTFRTFIAIAAFSTFATIASAGSYGGHCTPATPVCPPTYLQHSGQYVSHTYSHVTPAPVIAPHVQRWSNCGGYTNCNLTLAGPPLKSHDYYRGVTYTEHMPIARATREVVRGECPAGTTYQADGTCLQPGIIGGSSYSSYSSYSSGGSKMWTGGSEHFNESTGRYEHGWRKKHKSKVHHHKHKAHKVKRSCHSRKSHTVYDYESSSRCN